MTPTPEQRAILTRAAEREAARQAAVSRGDAAAARAAEDDLRALWRRFALIVEQAQATRGNDERLP
jgi:hypothetical protein